MSPTPPAAGAARSAEELNAAIRALFAHRDARLTDEQRAEYRLLLAELARVKQAGMTTAA